MGGRNTNLGYEKDVWYSSDGKTWTCATNNAPFSVRAYFAAIVYDNKMWVFGGLSDASAVCNDVWYSTDGKNWTCATTAAAWSKRQFHEAFVYDNKMWVAGGMDATNSLNDLWWSTDGKTWTSAPAAAWPKRRAFPTAIFNNKLWMSGGMDGKVCLNDIWYTDMPNSIQNSGKTVSPTASIMVNKIWSNISGNLITIQYALNKSEALKVSIYSSIGREIKTLLKGNQSSGMHTIEWNGTDAVGKAAGAGAYFVRFETGTGNVTQTIIKGK